MRPETFTVFNWEMDDPDADGHASGLTAEQAGVELLARAGCTHEIRRDSHGSAVLWIARLAPDDIVPALTATDIVSASDEPAAARTEIYSQVVHGDLALPGPWIASTDAEYRRCLIRAAHDVTEDEAGVMAKLSDGYYHTLVDDADRRLAEGLVARGILERLRQPRYKGASPLFRLAEPATGDAE